ncbi:MAG: prepilin-type N-terminal cleavage/methylation domain-containing protein [Acidobacteriota bacterium]
MKSNLMLSQPGRRSGRRGFSFVEVLVALTIFITVLAIVFSFFVTAAEQASTESSARDAQAQGRQAMDHISRTLMHVGSGVNRQQSPNNPAAWQQSLVHGGSHTLVFNADLDPDIGALSETISFPGGTYTGEAELAGLTTGAETYVYSIDANGDTTIDENDQAGGRTGVFQPQVETDGNPLDFGLFESIYGAPNEDDSPPGQHQAVAAFLYTNGYAHDPPDNPLQYPEPPTGFPAQPNQLFIYHVTEDINGNGALEEFECVVRDCSPFTPRTPEVYIWGDTNFDGSLSDAERTALRGLPVGSRSWGQNPFVLSGSYINTTIAEDAIAQSSNFSLLVDSVVGFGQGMRIEVDNGSETERFYVDQIDTLRSALLLSSAVTIDHGIGSTVTVLPQTLLAAVRSVELHFDAITPRPEDTGGNIAGRAGRQGTFGLEYRVRFLKRIIQLINVPTAASRTVADPTNLPECDGLQVEAVCVAAGSTTTTTDFAGVVPSSEAIEIKYRVRDGMNRPQGDVAVLFRNDDTSIGRFLDRTARTDGDGIATARYLPLAATASTDRVWARVRCEDTMGDLAWEPTTAELGDPGVIIDLNLSRIEIVRGGDDCNNTVVEDVAGGETAVQPSIPFTVTLTDEMGNPVANEEVSLRLAFDGEREGKFLPANANVGAGTAPSYADIKGKLYVPAGTEVGETQDDGSFTAFTTMTDAGGEVTGEVELSKDDLRFGARFLLVVGLAEGGCAGSGEAKDAFQFYRLELIPDDTHPDIAAGALCDATDPCVIGGGPTVPAPPRITAVASINGWAPDVELDVTFAAARDPLTGANEVFSPSGPAPTTNGEVDVSVGHDNSVPPSVTDPLVLTISAEAVLVDPGVDAETDARREGIRVFDARPCQNSAVSSIRPDVVFQYEGPVAQDCDVRVTNIVWNDDASSPVRRDGSFCFQIRNGGVCPATVERIGFLIHSKHVPSGDASRNIFFGASPAAGNVTAGSSQQLQELLFGNVFNVLDPGAPAETNVPVLGAAGICVPFGVPLNNTFYTNGCAPDGTLGSFELNQIEAPDPPPQTAIPTMFEARPADGCYPIPALQPGEVVPIHVDLTATIIRTPALIPAVTIIVETNCTGDCVDTDLDIEIYEAIP